MSSVITMKNANDKAFISGGGGGGGSGGGGTDYKAGDAIDIYNSTINSSY